MFDDIGGKIKIIGQILCWLGIGCSLFVGGLYISQEQIVAGFLIATIGALVSWISAMMIYGFGQLIQNSDIIAENMENLFEQQEYEE